MTQNYTTDMEEKTMYPINSTEYEKQFWNAMRGKNPTYDGLTQGRHQLTSSYTLPTANSSSDD